MAFSAGLLSIATSPFSRKTFNSEARLNVYSAALAMAFLWNEEVSARRGSSLTGTIVNLFVDIRMAPPLIDTSIVPEVPDYLYALFDYGLTIIELNLTIRHYEQFIMPF